MINYYKEIPWGQRKMIATILRHNAHQLLYKRDNAKGTLIKRPDNRQNIWYYSRRDYLTYLARKIMIKNYSPDYNDLINIWVEEKLAKPYLHAQGLDMSKTVSLLEHEWVIMRFSQAGNKYLDNPAKLSQMHRYYLKFIHNRYSSRQIHELMLFLTHAIEAPKEKEA